MLRGLYTMCSVFESIASITHLIDYIAYCMICIILIQLNRPHGLHLYTVVPDLVKAMDKIKNLSTLLLQIVDI